MSRVRQYAHLILPSLERGGEGHRFEELCQGVEQGRALMFEGERSILTVELIRDADGFSFNIWIVGGEMAEAITLLPGVEALARASGCPFVSFSGGRKGWKRVMTTLGYTWVGHEFRKVF